MKCGILFIALLLIVSTFAVSGAQEPGRIGLYVDDHHGEHCAYGSGFLPVEVWVWGYPGENGIKGVEFMVLYPDNIIPGTVTYTDSLQALFGDPANGVSVFFNNCRNDWCWPFHQTIYLASEAAGLVQMYPKPELVFPWYDISIYICDGGATRERAERISNVCINFCSEDIDPPEIEEVDFVNKSRLEVTFSEEVTVGTAENVGNYSIYNRLTGGDSIQVTSATLLGGGATVALDLESPFLDNTPYLVKAERVADAAGNMWISTGQFGNGPDLIITEMVFQDTIPGCTKYIDVTYTVANIGEFPASDIYMKLSFQGVDEDGVPLNGDWYNVDEIEEIAAGDSFTQRVYGRHPMMEILHMYTRLSVTADFVEYIDEAREDNNTRSSMLINLAPRISSVTAPDVSVHVEFDRAFYDRGDVPEPVTVYEIHRRDDTLGIYESVAAVAADCSQTYEADFPPFPGVEFTRFFIRAIRPAGADTHNYDCCEDWYPTGADVAPAVPTGFVGRQVGDDLLLTWNRNEEPDFFEYKLYGGDNPDFVPDVLNRISFGIHMYRDTFFVHHGWEPDTSIYYKLCAIDWHDHTSGYALLEPENVVETLLQSFAARIMGTAVEISWCIARPMDVSCFRVLRRTEKDIVYKPAPGPVVQNGRTTFVYRDGGVVPGERYVYRLDVLEEADHLVLFETEPVGVPLMPLTLFQNHPNPFNPLTEISYCIPRDGRVELAVYDIRGRRIACLVEGMETAGRHTATWDGRTGKGITVSSGIYFYRLRFGKSILSRKMVLMR
jgi:hypothetical protein